MNKKYTILCKKHLSRGMSNCPECFLEWVSEHIEFRNGTMILKKVEIEG